MAAPVLARVLLAAAAGTITPTVEMKSGPTSLSKAPRLPSLKAGFSTQAGGGFDSGHATAMRYSPVRPDVVSMVNGPGTTQVRMGGWSTWWMDVGDKPVVSIAGRDGSGAYSSPGVINGVGVSGTARLAVRNASGGAKWLENFDRCEALLAPGTATWRCTDAEMGAVNLTTFPLQTNQTGIILRATASRRAATVVWAIVLTGKNDTVVLGTTYGVGTARLTSDTSQQSWGNYTELRAAALPSGRAAVADAVVCAGTVVPAASSSATTNPCAVLTATPSCGAAGGWCSSDLAISWGYRDYDHQAVSEALQRLEDQRSMYDPRFYTYLINGTDDFDSWFTSWVGRSLNPAAAHAKLLKPGGADAAVHTSVRWNAKHRPLRLLSPDVEFDVAFAHCSGEMMYQYEHPGFLHGTHDAKYGKISIGTFGATAAGYHEEVARTLHFIAGTQDPLTHRQRYWSPGLAIANWAEEQDFYFVEQVLFHIQWSNIDGSGTRYLRSIWPAVKRAMEQGLRASDPDDDGVFTGYYEYWDNDTRDRGGKCVEQTALALSALRAAAKMAGLVGDSTKATKYSTLANRTADLMTSTFWQPHIGAWSSAEWNGDVRLKPEAQENFPVTSRGLGDYVSSQQAYLSSRYLRENLFIGNRDNITLEVINDWWPIIWSHQYVANGDAAQSVLAACRAGDVDGFHPMLKSVTKGQYFTADASMGNEQYNDGYAAGMQDLVELQPALLEAAIRGYYGLDLQLMDDLVVISPNLPTAWIETGEMLSIILPDLNYTFQQVAGKLTVELHTSTARMIEMHLPVHAAVHGVTVKSGSSSASSEAYMIEGGLVNRARVVVQTSSATTFVKTEISLGADASVTGNRMVVIGVTAKFSIANAHAIAIHDPQGVLNQSNISMGQITLTPTVDQWELQEGLEGWPLPATVFVEMVAEAPAGMGAKPVTWLSPLDLMLVPPWRLETIAVAAEGEVPTNRSSLQLGCPDGTAPPCVVLPRLGEISQPPAPAPVPPQPPPPLGTLQMVDCASPKALNFTATAVANGTKGPIQVVGTQLCLSTGGVHESQGKSIVLQNCSIAPHWYWRSGYHTKAGGHLCVSSDTDACLDRAHHAADSTTVDTYLFVPTSTEKFHDENWSLDEAGHLVSRCVEPSCAAHQCVGGEIPPIAAISQTTEQLFAPTNVSVTLVLRNDGGAAISGPANVSIPALQFWMSVQVSLVAGGQQPLVVYITDPQQLGKISPGTTRILVTLAGRTQVADAVRWTPPPGHNYSATIRPLDLSSAFNFDAEDLYSTRSIAARWRLDYTGAGIGIEAQLRYNK